MQALSDRLAETLAREWEKLGLGIATGIAMAEVTPDRMLFGDGEDRGRPEGVSGRHKGDAGRRPARRAGVQLQRPVRLMGALVGGTLRMEDRLVVYTPLYRLHLIAIHSRIEGLALLLVSRINAIVRPRH